MCRDQHHSLETHHKHTQAKWETCGHGKGSHIYLACTGSIERSSNFSSGGIPYQTSHALREAAGWGLHFSSSSNIATAFNGPSLHINISCSATFFPKLTLHAESYCPTHSFQQLFHANCPGFNTSACATTAERWCHCSTQADSNALQWHHDIWGHAAIHLPSFGKGEECGLCGMAMHVLNTGFVGDHVLSCLPWSPCQGHFNKAKQVFEWGR